MWGALITLQMPPARRRQLDGFGHLRASMNLVLMPISSLLVGGCFLS